MDETIKVTVREPLIDQELVRKHLIVTYTDDDCEAKWKGYFLTG